MLVPLQKRIWTLIGGYGIMGVLFSFEVDPIRGSLALARGYKGNSHEGQQSVISVQTW